MRISGDQRQQLKNERLVVPRYMVLALLCLIGFLGLKSVEAAEPQPHGLFKQDGRKEMCQYCHSTHTGGSKQLILKKTMEDTCYLCHDGTGSVYDVKSEFNVQTNPTHHKVPEGKTFCTDCHNPHFQTTPSTSATTSKINGSTRLLFAERYGNGPSTKGNEFCWVCHGANSELPRPFGLDHQQYFNNSGHSNTDWNTNTIKMPLPASGTEIVCINCHEQHGSPNYPLLNGANDYEFCVNCHTSMGYTKSYDGISRNSIVINNTSNNFAGSPHETAFYGRNGCNLCHEPHGTKYKFMLKLPFPQTNAGVKSPPNGDALLCFECHDSRYYLNGGRPLVGSRFGNGNGENYHWHVDEKDEQDQRASCRVCHDPHSGSNHAFEGYRPNWNLNNPVNVDYDWSYAKGKVNPDSNGRLAFVAAGYDSSGEATGYSCYMRCDKDHDPIGYIRKTSNTPALKCLACHSYEEFELNSAHPVVYAGTESGLKVKCETCHDPNHLNHTSSNPYGLWKTIKDWPNPGDSLTVYDQTYGYRVFCYGCHGTQKTVTSDGDYQSHFEGKPHAYVSRATNPYGTTADGTSKDMSCLACHEKHGSTNVKLLVRDIDKTDSTSIDADTDRGKIYACLDCHDGSPAKQNIATLYNAPKSAGHFIKSVDSSKKLLCTECHSPHGTTNSNYLWDRDKYDVFADPRNVYAQVYGAAVWPTNMDGEQYLGRDFCMACHPASDVNVNVYYDTTKTIKVTSPGEPTNIIKIGPMSDTVASHTYSSTDKCSMCHDPHKPWPATGSNADCYLCHGNSGEAYNIEVLMGLNGTSSTGKASKHIINDPSTADTNDCMTMCHKAHPHEPRADVLKQQVEKDVCMTCHDEGSAGTQPKIIGSQYSGKPHDYDKGIHSYSDGSTFKGNCLKCHVPHGSDYAPLLRWQNGDSLCNQCHNGTTTDGNGNPISNIKTMYDKYGHYYKADKTKKLRCAECHIPHGSTNAQYLRDNGTAEIYTNGDLNQHREFPIGLGPEESRRPFCNTCHLYSDEGTETSFVRYISSSAPGGQIDIPRLASVGAQTGIVLPEHATGDATECNQCHNAHDPRPTGTNKDCYKCHGGDNAFAQNIDLLSGYWDGAQNTWPDGAGGRTTTTTIVSYHKISDGNSANTNTCMASCHQPHPHNPKSNLVKDLRTTAGDVYAPNMPTMQGASALSNSDIAVSWTPSDSNDIAGYYIFRNDFVATNPIGVLNSSATSGTLTFRDGGVTGSNSYKVLAFDTAGNKTALTSSEVSATTSIAADTEAPTVPGDVKISMLSSARISLSWTKSTDNSLVLGYNIYRSTDGNNYTLIGYTGKTSFVDGAGEQDTLAQETTYYYKVAAVDINTNESGLSSSVSGTTPKAEANKFGSGNYWSNGETFEIFNSNNTRTNRISAWETTKIKVTTPDVSSPTTATVTVKNLTGATLNTYNLSKTSTTSPYSYEVSFQGPGTEGLYVVEVYVTDGTRTLRTSDALEVHPTTKLFRTYEDLLRTTEKTTFLPGERVYVKVAANYSHSIGTSHSLELRDWNNNTLTTLTIEDISYDGLSVKYSFVMPDLPAMKSGDWYAIWNRFTGRSNETIANSYKQVRFIRDDVTPPVAPTLNDPTSTDKSVGLSWSLSPDSDVDGYTVYRQEGAGSFYKAGSVDNATNSFTDTGLKPSTSYTYKVSAFDAHGNAATSSTKSISTQIEIEDNTAPAAPTGVNAKAKDAASIEVSWASNSATDGVAGYNIYRIVGDGDITPTILKVGSTTQNSYLDGGLSSGTTYSYRVSAYDMYGNESGMSSITSAQTGMAGGQSIEGQLCMSCHDGTNSPSGAPIIGKAYNLTDHNNDVAVKTMSDGSTYYGNCTKCHVPHGSEYPDLLKGPMDNQLCFKCHESATDNHKYSGKRTYEMSLHALTSAAPNGTPLVFRDVYAGVYYDGTPRDPSNPSDVTAYAGMCFNCHVSHGRYTLDENGNQLTDLSVKANLRQGTRFTVGGSVYVSSNDICADCHGETNYGGWYGFEAYSKTDHGNVNKTLTMWDAESAPGECANCHDPHGTEYGAMLKLPMNTDALDTNGKTLKNAVCLKCHDRSEVLSKTYWFKGGDKYQLSTHFRAQWWTEVAEQVYNKDTQVYETVYKKQTAQYVPGNCMNCHNSHGKEDPNNPGQVYPEQLLLSPDSNELCYYCHDEFVLAQRVDDGVDNYWYIPMAPGYPTTYYTNTDGSDYVYSYTYDGFVNATTKASGKSIYDLSSHGSDPDMIWPGSTNYPNDEASGGGSNEQYNTEFVQSGLLGYWSFDDSTANDIWKTNHGTVSGATFVAGNIPGRTDFGNAANFDGNDSIILPPMAVNGGTTTNSFTWEGWVYMQKEYAASGDEQELFHRPATDNYGLVHYEIVHDAVSSDGKNGLRITVRKDDRTNLVHGSPIAYKPPTGQWIHLAVVYDGSVAVGENAGFVYENGVLKDILSKQVDGPVGGETMNWYLGKTSENIRYFVGKMDEVKLYNRPLTATEVAQNYNALTNDKTLIVQDPNDVPETTHFAANSCYNCHDPHGSGNTSSTLEPATTLCLNCHDGAPSTKSVSAQFDGSEGHRVKDSSMATLHEPGRTDWTAVNKDDSTKTVQCADCHEPHSAQAKDALGKNNLKASGISSGGSFKPVADYQYEVCIKCHGKFSTKTTLPTGWTDVRDRFQTTRDSHHGVYASKSNSYVNTTTLTSVGDAIIARSATGQGKMLCSDCHYAHTLNDPTNNPYNLKLAADDGNYSTSGSNAWRVRHCLYCHEAGVYTSDNSSSRFSRHADGGKHRNNTYGCYSCHGGNPNDSSEKGYMHGFTWNGYSKFIRGWSVATYDSSRIGSKSGCTLLNNTCGDHNTTSSRTSAN